MSNSKNADVVRQAYDNFKTGNIPSLLNLLSTDVDWRLPRIEGVPHSGAHRGREAVGKFFASVGMYYEWRIKPTGKTFTSDFVHVFTVREGHITGFSEFLDTAAETAAWAK